MHPKQAELIARLDTVTASLTRTAAPAVLYKYTDDAGQEFWLSVKKTTIKSPYTGKSFSAKPQKVSPSAVAKDLKSDEKGKAILFKYTDEDGNEFWLPQKKSTAKSPFTGKSVKSPEKDSISEVAKDLKTDKKASFIEADEVMVAVHTAATPVLYKYVDEDGNEFWLKEKKTTAKSPYSGKSVRFEQGNKDSLSEVQKDLKTDVKKASSLNAALDALGLE